jgi:DNA-binding NarL/FixJ family response regulator
MTEPDLHQLITTHLTPKQAQVFRDRLNGHPFTRIGHAYGITEATARGHYQAALRKLEPHLRKDAA